MFGQVDENQNLMSDVWEVAYGITEADEDDDGDGFSNLQESAAGTNPKDPVDFPKSLGLAKMESGHLCHNWPTKAGIRYQTWVSGNLVDWKPVGAPVIGSGGVQQQILNPTTAFTSGGVARSKWTGISIGFTQFKANASAGIPVPQIQDRIQTLEIRQTDPNESQFGQWVRGWIVAPARGSYTFWFASDDRGEFWLSTDADPSNKSMLCNVPDWASFREWTKHASQRSSAVNLTANQAYYFEIYQMEGGGGDHFSVAWTRPGMAEGSREIIDAPHLSSTGQSLEDLMAGGQIFAKLSADHVDSDGDGVSDYEEHFLGLDPALAASIPRSPDRDSVMKTLTSPSTVTLGVSRPRAYEAEDMTAEFTVFRSGGIGALEVPYILSGNAESGADFIALPGIVRIPPGSRSVKIPIHPMADILLESRETVTLTLSGAPGYQLGSSSEASVTIDDAADLLYIAQLRAAPDVTSAGFGSAAVRRAGNSLTGTVKLSFSGLSGKQAGAEIFISSNGLTGPAIYQFPLHQVPASEWNFEAVNGVSRNEILQALDEGRVWVRVTSGNPEETELLGRLQATPAWETMPPPVVPPPAPEQAETTGQAARFLTQATFGPSEADLQTLEDVTFETWIDAQIAMPPSLHLPYMQARRAQWLARNPNNDGWQGPRNEAWWQHALTAPDQLRQRMAFALSQILVISQFGALDGQHEGTTRYYDLLVDHAFGNYRDLLGEITRSPMMGTYLSMMRNRKPDPITGHEPDENYAREIMQLFSVGLNRMHTDGTLQLDSEGMPIPTYTQEDTVELAHVFTGWGPHYDPADPPRWDNGSIADRSGWFTWGYDGMRPMTFYQEFHDTNERTILNGNVIPAGADGIARLDLALDALFQHPNAGPFLARQLIQRFVTSNPSPGYIHRVAGAFNDNGEGVRGDLGATIKAVLLDFEARDPSVRTSASYGKPAEPVLRVSRMHRVLKTTTPLAGNPNYYLNLQWDLPEQAPLLSPSVFNFFQPGYSNPGNIARAGLLSPEFQIFAETTAIRQANSNYAALNWGRWTAEGASVTINYDDLVAILNTPGKTPVEARELLIDHLDDRLLFGEMSAALRDEIRNAFTSLPSWYDFRNDHQRGRARMTAYLILNSPEFFVQK